jgi:oligosaccharyltransferase complex subunit beta
MKAAVALVVLVSLCALIIAETTQGKRTLAVLESGTIKETHSIFFKSLADRGHKLTYVTADTPSIPLHKYGEYLYDNLVIFAPKIGDSLDADQVIDFINDGRNVILAADTGVSATLRDIASECGVGFAESNTAVIDHHSFDKSDFEGRHTSIIAGDVIDASVILGNKKPTHILFRGIGQEVRESPRNYRILSASSTSYSGRFDGKGAVPKILGRNNVLVSALQARNNARVVISGSIHLFSDAAFKAQLQKYDVDAKAAPLGASGNQEFATELSKWVFQERGVIRYRNLEHALAATGETPKHYTIKDDIKFSIVIEELVDGKWVPFKANDVQLEFIMLDPYIRVNLKHDGKGKYSTTFKAPDVYGVFTFKVDYQRVGYSGLTAIARSPVRPFRHDQYERFIPSAFPYYAGAFSMLAGLFIFSVVFLYHQESKKPVKA